MPETPMPSAAGRMAAPMQNVPAELASLGGVLDLAVCERHARSLNLVEAA